MCIKSIFLAIGLACVIAFVVLLQRAVAQSAPTVPPPVADLIVYDASSYQGVQAVFHTYSYNVKNNWTGKVPAIAANYIPNNLKDASVQHRKQLFIQMMIPLIVRANQHIISERSTVENLYTAYRQNGELTHTQQQTLARIANRYKAKGDTEVVFRTLQYRVQPIVVSLALAQAIMESGWGTSRFAREGNSLFGQWTFRDNTGLVPQDRDADKTHQVKAFDSPYDSVVSYMLNLNRHGAYADLRKVRYNAIINNTPISGHALAVGLNAYSQLGDVYVTKIRQLIRSNKLEKYNTAVFE